MHNEIQIKRAYAPPAPGDGLRILVDRLWPRGLRKETLALGLWARDIAPSSFLRKSFGHMEEHFESFRSAYLAELAQNPEAAGFVRTVAGALETRPVTLIYAARNEAANHALVLKKWLESQL